MDARAGTLLDRLTKAQAKGYALTEAERLRLIEMLVRRLELVLETQGDKVLPAHQEQILDLYDGFLGLESGCGSTLALPQPNPQSCSATLADLNEKLLLCSR